MLNRLWGGFWMACGRGPGLSGTYFGAIGAPKSIKNPFKMDPGAVWAPQMGPGEIIMRFGEPILWIWEAKNSPNGPQTCPNGSQDGPQMGPKLVNNASRINGPC